MRHTAHGDAYAHDAQELIQLLIQEAGCQPDEVYSIDMDENVSGQGKRCQAAIIEESSEEYVLHVEADNEDELMEILDGAGIKSEKKDDQ